MAQADLAFDVIARDKASKTFRDVGRESDSTGKKLAGFAKAGAAAVAGFALAGAAAVTALAAAGTAFALEKSKSDALLAGQLGVTGAAAKDLGKAAGQVYAQGWAESIGEASDAIRATIQNQLVDPLAGSKAIEAMATRTAAAAQLMTEEFDRVGAAVSQMLRTGMAGSAEEAFDLLTVATQKGINKSQDLLDTVNEYGTLFRALGLDGPTALGLLSQAIAAGARSSDVAADALKEFAIRAVDGSTLSAKGFRALGLDAAKMTAQIAGGGEAAKTGLDLVLDRLRAMKDPVAQNAAAVALFGTKAEDLGQALFAFDPATAVAALGTLTDASDKFIESQTSAGQRVDAMWRNTLVALEDKLGPAINGILDKLEEWGSDPEIQAWLDELGEDIDEIATDLMPMLTASFQFFVDSFKDNKEEVTLGIKLMVAGLGLLLVSIMTLGGVMVHVAGFTAQAFRTMVAFVLSNIGMFIGAAEAAFSWIPGLGPKLTQAKAAFADFAKGVNDALAGIKDRHVKVHVTASGTKFTTGGSIPFGGGFQEMAHGGPVVKGRPYIVGDGGRPELFVPDQDGVILPSVPSGSGSSGGVQVIELRATGFGSGLDRLFLSWLQGALRGNPGVRLTTA